MGRRKQERQKKRRVDTLKFHLGEVSEREVVDICRPDKRQNDPILDQVCSEELAFRQRERERQARVRRII